MKLESTKIKLSKSNEYLSLCKRYLKQAQEMDADDDKRKWLEEEAARLFEEARNLNQEARQAVTKYEKSL